MTLDAETLLKSAATSGKRRSLTELVIQALNDKIDRGEYAPGAKIPIEAELCTEFGVSRTVIREAVASLKLGRRLIARHGVGVFVAEAGSLSSGRDFIDGNTLNNSMHVLELRIGVETECAAYAALRRSEAHLKALKEVYARMEIVSVEDDAECARADFEFHLAIATCSENPHFSSILRTLGQEIIIDLRLKHAKANAKERKTYIRRIQREHADILDAIERQDEAAARRAMRRHLNESLERYHHLTSTRAE
ncbi:FadR/GntR family transcriptional regulator [Paraburkholderia unamae]|uniref:GntR family transcriptional regulator n=1 Tax=Paraburkholderia unamae TaxID=219649 RepID=A0ABX5KBP5_9BURK|nr:FadR/GntR family transcriptional regulator [Paraburkholderia unamae]PVX73196.1 GntR family transcriptional regulator [Paraburkholderia unamae]CAG9258194.1 Predicted D-glucarate or D-galactorate regulator, GntR family [Paraburkholderia unamae]